MLINIQQFISNHNILTNEKPLYDFGASYHVMFTTRIHVERGLQTVQ